MDVMLFFNLRQGVSMRALSPNDCALMYRETEERGAAKSVFVLLKAIYI
jgi:hypothetical protein